MTSKMFKDEFLIGEVIAEEIITVLKNKPTALICIAAGSTSIPLFESLVSKHKEGGLSFNSSYFIAMDEWKGMNASVQGSCGDFLNKHFFSQVDYQKKHVRLVDGRAGNLKQECKDLYTFIEDHGGIDYIVLGAGMNGHLALNEPGVSFDKSVHVSELDSVTKVVGKKYFENSPQLEGGVTIGIADIKKAKKVVLIITGNKKVDVLDKILKQEPNNMFPATAIKNWEQSLLVYDEKATGK